MEWILEFSAPIIVGICLCIGYILKNVVTTDKINKYIPLIMGVLGVGLNCWINLSFTPEILLTGLISGLSSTGLHQVFKNLINKNSTDETEE